MRPLLLSYADTEGGAARAAYRLHRSLLDQGVDSHMKVRNARSGEWRVEGSTGMLAKLCNTLRAPIGNWLARCQSTTNHNLRSINCLPSRWSASTSALQVDVVNLHWVAGEALSIEDIGRIGKPIVWTLHDMWPFSGAEHYGPDDDDARWRDGYSSANRPVGSRGLDLDRWAWWRKRRAWRHPMHIVAPSRWLARCASESALFADWPVTVIPNPLDTTVYRPYPRSAARDLLNLPQDRHIVLFGALGATSDPRKGRELLFRALGRIAASKAGDRMLCVVFGQAEPERPTAPALPTRWLGHLHDDVSLALLYSAADVMVVPSLQENLPQTATEAQACGCPVVAFDCTGLPDAVVHEQTGYLAAAYDSNALADGILWLLGDDALRHRIGEASRERAVRLWAARTVAEQYLAVFSSALKGK